MILRGGESHSYLLTLAEKRFIHLKVAKKGINMVITVFGPDDKMIVKVDSRNGDVGEEQVYFITDNAGRYRIRIDSLEKDANVGRYVILLAEVREPTSEDEVLLEADSIVSQVDEWNGPRSSSDYDQAAEKLEREQNFMVNSSFTIDKPLSWLKRAECMIPSQTTFER